MRDSIYIANISIYKREGKYEDIPTDIPDHIMTSKWDHSPLDMAVKLARVLRTLLGCMESIWENGRGQLHGSLLPVEAWLLVDEDWVDDFLSSPNAL